MQKKNNIFANMMSQNRDFDRLASIRNPNTAADEVAAVIRVVLYALVIFTGVLTCLNWMNKFEGMLPKIAALALTVTLVLLIEVSKVWIGRRFIRSLFQCWIVQSWAAFGFWMFIGAVSVGSFYFSVLNSTQGIQSFVLAKEFSNPPNADFSQVASIDAQILNANEQLSRAHSLKVENGLTSWEGQKQAKKIAEGIKSLQEQRKIALDAANTSHAQSTSRWEEVSRSKGSQTYQLGGWLEALTLILMFAIELSLSMLVAQHIKDAQPNQSSNQSNTTPPQPIRNGNNIPQQQPINSRPADNSTHTRPIVQAFTSHKEQTIDLIADCDTVPQFHSNVQPTFSTKGIEGEAAFVVAFSDVRKDVANLNNENGKPTTVCDRIGRKLDTMREVPTAQISESTMTKWTNYLTNTAIPIFERVGYKPDLNHWLDYEPVRH